MIRIAPTVHLSAFELISEQCDMMDKSRAEPGPMNRWVNKYFAETPDHQELLKVLFHIAFILLSYCFHIVFILFSPKLAYYGALPWTMNG